MPEQDKTKNTECPYLTDKDRPCPLRLTINHLNLYLGDSQRKEVFEALEKARCRGDYDYKTCDEFNSLEKQKREVEQLNEHIGTLSLSINDLAERRDMHSDF